MLNKLIIAQVVEVIDKVLSVFVQFLHLIMDKMNVQVQIFKERKKLL